MSQFNFQLKSFLSHQVTASHRKSESKSQRLESSAISYEQFVCVVFSGAALSGPSLSVHRHYSRKEIQIFTVVSTNTHTSRISIDLRALVLNCVVVFREKSKKFAEQAAAIVCLRVLGIPEGRIGEEDSGLVCKRKREAKMNGITEEEGIKKRHVAEQETDNSKMAAVANGDHHKPDTPPE